MPQTNCIGRTLVRPYVRATNGAIACSIRVNSMVRSLPCSHPRQFYRAHVYAPLRTDDKGCDRSPVPFRSI
ncbi:MAG: hypothetical protein RID09_00730 [Coleofasciculus sp. G1-WW12-02]|uniref:hypothetical protein n=1 Tax=Coleofasciculus sp. G1-WW12-02 TaxID=3068483 RepID=UPI0033050506